MIVVIKLWFVLDLTEDLVCFKSKRTENLCRTDFNMKLSLNHCCECNHKFNWLFDNFVP